MASPVHKAVTDGREGPFASLSRQWSRPNFASESVILQKKDINLTSVSVGAD